MPHTWRQPAYAFINHQQLQDETLPQPRNTSLITGMRSEKSHVGTSILIQHCCKDPFSIVIMLHTGCFTNNLKCRKLGDSQQMPSPTTKKCKMNRPCRCILPQPGHISFIASMRSEKSHVGTSILIQHCCKDPFSIVIMLHTGCFTNNVKCHKLGDSQHMPSRTTNNCKMKHTATPFPPVHIALALAHISS